jgi:class 3 adenylate cyclase/ATP/maltotriose-dependent transcriptional regulator MalT
VERKLATVLFVDLVGSTEFLANVDAEVARRRMTRFFDQVSTCILAHGGVIEKFAGDAVMAAFGVPQAHEDDAERGVRAAIAIQEAVCDLGVEVRIGIESGEVVIEETESTFATGEAVNVAARLQQAAAAGEILIGPGLHARAGAGIRSEELDPIDVRGLERPLPVWRLEGTAEDNGRALHLSARFVGREAELELLENTYRRAVRDKRAHVVTMYGEPGVGKSRLAREFIAGLERTTVLVGRCLPYGEGITYWPLAEMVKAAAGIADDDPAEEALDKLRECCGEEAVAELLGLAFGVLDAVSGERSAQEIAWAAVELATELAGAQPLVLGFEDIHWAEDPLLDLIEHLAERVRDVPLLIVCLARVELFDQRPDWGGGRRRSTAIELEPLALEESEELVDALVAEHGLSPVERATLLEKSEGNPLFLEETVRMLAEQGSNVDGRIPDTVQALIAARIDRLPRRAKAVLQRAAVVGRVFWEGALVALSHDAEDVREAIEELERRDFVIREERSTISGERAYRFKHVLIRDVAYAGLSKGARAELHRKFAAWLQQRGVEELVEIRAYHLDHAVELLAELDGTAPGELVSEAAAALTGAGTRALAREANRSGRKLLLRAVELEPTLERRYQAARAAVRLTDLPAISIEMEAVRAAAAEAGDRRLEGRALTALADVALSRDADVPRARELGTHAFEVLPEDDDHGRFDALAVLSAAGWWEGDLESVRRYSEESLEVARRLGRKDLQSGAFVELASALYAQLEDAAAEQYLAPAIELAEESGSFTARAWVARTKGQYAIRRERWSEAEELLREAHRLFMEAGVTASAARVLNWIGVVRWRQGDLKRAEQLLREAIGMLKPLEERGTLVESQRLLAQVLLEQDRVEEAERYALEARQTVGARDMASRATTRLALGLVRAAQGRDDEAETLMREGLEILAATAYRRHEIEHLRALAGFLRERGRDDEAASYEERLAELEPAPSTAPIA